MIWRALLLQLFFIFINFPSTIYIYSVWNKKYYFGSFFEYEISMEWKNMKIFLDFSSKIIFDLI